MKKCFFKGNDEWLVSRLELKIKLFDIAQLKEYQILKKVSDIINKAKNNKENIAKHGQIIVDLPNYLHFYDDILVCTDNLPKKVYKYLNNDTKIIDTIEFSDYKSWYKQNNVVW